MRKDNFYTTFYWMVSDLKLKGAELTTFAIIYSFSQDGVSWFSGSLSYIADFIGVSKQTVITNLKKLVDKGFVVKRERLVNNVQMNDYKVDLEVVKKFDYQSKNLNGVVKKFDRGSQKTLMGVVKKFDPIYIRDNYSDIDKESIERKAQRFVPPTLDDIQSYITEKNLCVSAERFYSYYESNGWKVGKNSMKSWKAALHSWNARDKQEKQQAKDSDGIDSTYDIDELEKRAMFGEVDI